MGQRTAQRGPRARRDAQAARDGQARRKGGAKSDLTPTQAQQMVPELAGPTSGADASDTHASAPAQAPSAAERQAPAGVMTAEPVASPPLSVPLIARAVSAASSAMVAMRSMRSMAALVEAPEAPEDAAPPSGGARAVEWAAAARDWSVAHAQAGGRWLRGLSAESWVWIGILALATLLRFWGLGDKPLHHDESMHAFYSLQFALDPASYWYDPLLHGPFQFHAEGIIFAIIIALSHIFQVASSAGNPWINDTTARILPATTGVVLVGLTYGLRRQLGRIGAPIAAFLLAVSPAFVYFSRFLREDIYFCCFMYATVVCAVQFWQKRTIRWLVATTVAFVLMYATLEAAFLNVAIWGSFLAVLIVWEIGHSVSQKLPSAFSDRERAFFGHTAPLLLLGGIGSAAGVLGLRWLEQTSVYINNHTPQTDAIVKQLEDNTVTVLLYASIALALIVIAVLLRQIFYDLDTSGDAADDAAVEVSAVDDVTPPSHHPPARRRLAELADRLDPVHQPFLRMLLGITWVGWFVAFVAGWVLFAALYWVIPGPDHGVLNIAQGFQVGVGRGIWQGLYYWLQQQHVARGGQPWYYYLLLIPLYEQLAVVFGVAGMILALVRPTRFRLFLVWWFVGSLAIYSWAGEKMPWLSIQILLPLMLLAALPIAALVSQGIVLLGRLRSEVRSVGLAVDGDGVEAGAWQGRFPSGVFASTRVRLGAVALGLLGAVALLVPMLYNMAILSHQDAANGPHEMMVYVQTTPDVQVVMDKITQADARMYGGQHRLRIGVGQGEEWPFYWYLRDYWLMPHPLSYVSFEYPVQTASAPTEDVLILTPEDAATFQQQHPTGYSYHTYQLRSWWDEGYKPPPCIPTKQNPCTGAAAWGGGVGVGNWLSYGDTPPPHARFNLGRAASRVWQWLWLRKPLGDASGPYYEFVFVVRNGVPTRP